MPTIPTLTAITAAELSTADKTYAADVSASNPQDRSLTFGELATFLGNNAPVVKVSSSGTRTFYTPTADTNAARGTVLKAAFAALSAGDTLYFHGTFFVDAQLEVPANNISIIGSGIGSTVILSDTLDAAWGFPRIYVNGKIGVTLRGFKIEQNNQAPGFNGLGIFTAGACRNNYIDSVWLEKCGGLYIASTPLLDENATVSNCVLSNSVGGGITTGPGSEYSAFINNRVRGTAASNEYAVYDQGGNNTWVGNRLESNYNGYYGLAQSNHGHSTWVGGSINHTTGAALQFQTGYIAGFQFIGTSIYGGQINLYGCQGVRFNGCNIDAAIRVNLAQPLAGFNYFKDCNVNLSAGAATIKDTTGATLSSSSPTERAKIKVIDCLDMSTGVLWTESSTSI